MAKLVLTMEGIKRLSIPAALLLLLGAGAFWNGLYAPMAQVLATAVLAVAMLRGEGGVVLARPEWAALLLLVVGAGLSLTQAVSAGNAAHGPVIIAGWVIALLMGRSLLFTGVVERALGLIWAVTGSVMVFGGILSMSYLPVHHSARLASYLGYPIALGVLGMLGAAAALPALKAKRWWAPLLLMGNGLAIVLSGSRGVWAVAALLVLYLIWARPALLREAWWPAAVALVAALWVGPAVAGREQIPAIIAVSLACLTMLLRYPFQWGAARGFGLVVAAALAPGWHWFLGRAGALPLTEGSSVERLTMLRDGLALTVQWPLGAGYRAWTTLHLQGASYGYYSAEVHSAPVDLALAFGWIGVVGFLLLVGRLLLSLRDGRTWTDERLVVMAGLGALAVHSMVDWDLSYGLFMIPLWLGFGLVAPGAAPWPRRGISMSARAMLVGLAVAGAVLIGAGDLFTTLADRSLAVENPTLAYRHARMATAVAPWYDPAHAAIGQALSLLGQQEGALAAFEHARYWGPREPWYVQLHAQELLAASRWLDAADAYRALPQLWPWEVYAYEVALDAHLEMAMHAIFRGDIAMAARLTQSGQSILAALDAQKAREPAGAPRRPMDLERPIIRQARAFLHAQP